MRPRLLNLLMVLSLLLCEAALALWVHSSRHAGAITFTVRGERWAVRWQSDRISVDNAPQRQLERQAWRRETDRLRLEGTSAREVLATANDLARHAPLLDRAIDEELQRLRREVSRNVGATLAHEAMPPERSAPVEYSANVAAATAAFAVLPLAWASRAALRWWRRSQSRRCKTSAGRNANSEFIGGGPRPAVVTLKRARACGRTSATP